MTPLPVPFIEESKWHISTVRTKSRKYDLNNKFLKIKKTSYEWHNRTYIVEYRARFLDTIYTKKRKAVKQKSSFKNWLIRRTRYSLEP